MNRSIPTIAMLIAALASIALATHALAMEETPYTANLAPPPESFAISPGGVDIRTGRYVQNETDLSIGDPVGGLTLTRILSSAIGGHIDPFANFAHNWDLTLVERRISIATGQYTPGSGPDFRLTVNLDGHSETFQGYSTESESFQLSKSPYARLTSVGDRNSAGVIYTFQASGGMRVIFRALGGGDCTIGALRCAFASQVLHADGTQFDLEYQTATPVPGSSSGARLRSVISNRGYALLLEYSGGGDLWNMVTKACVLNLALVAKPTDNVCPANAVATVNYTYTTFGGKPKLATVAGAAGGTAGYSYSSISGTSVTGAPSTFYAMSHTKAGQSMPWQTAHVALTTNNEGAFDQIITQQNFADGSSYAYSYNLTPQVDGEFSSVAGGTITDALSHTLAVEYDFPVLPPVMNPPRPGGVVNIGDVNYQVTPGPTKVTDALGRITHLDYCDPNAMANLPPWVTDRCLVTRIQSATDPENIRTDYTFSLGHLIQTRTTPKPGSPLAQIVRSVGDNCLGNLTLCGKPQTATDARNKVTDFTYNSTHGGMLTATLPAPTAGAVRPQRRYTYTQLYAWFKNASGSLAQAPTPVWMLTGISECRTQASCSGTEDETRTTITYGTPGTPNNLLPTSETIAAGDGSVVATTTYTYDPQGNRLTVDGPLASAADTTRYRYDALRRLVGEITPDPDGSDPLPHRATRNSYNFAGDLIKVERGTVPGQSDGDWAAFAALQAFDADYDSQARKVREFVSGGGTTFAVTQYSYDQARRLECTAVRMNPGAFASSPASACSLGTEGSYGPDRITRNIYDAADQLTKVQKGYGTSVQIDYVSNTYNPNGTVGTVADANGNITTYEYDGFDRLAKTIYPTPENGSTPSISDFEQLEYDPGSNITQLRQRDGKLIGYEYDALSRMTSMDLPDTSGTTNPDLTYGYDNVAHVLSVADSGGAQVSYTYDALGHRLTEGNGVRTLTSGYDDAGRRTSLTWDDSFSIIYEYLTTGELSAVHEPGVTSGPGLLATFGYDALGRRTGITRGNGSSTSYGYDALRLTSLGQDLTGTSWDNTLGFTYNPAAQIATQTSTNAAYNYPDPNGTVRSYLTNALNQYTQTNDGTPLTLNYDGRGNLTSGGVVSYAYDARNLLLSATSGGATFTYDPTSRMRTIGAEGRVLDYDGANLVAEYDSAGALMRRYVHSSGIDEPLVYYEGAGTGTRRWLHADQQGSIVAVSDSAGNSLGINSYDPYGLPASTNIGRFQYTGQTWVQGIGLAYYKARMYSPKLGRFMQVDPIGYRDDVNLYAYARNDPLNKTDPSGTQCRQEQRHGMQKAEPTCSADFFDGQPIEKARKAGKIDSAAQAKIDRQERNAETAYAAALAMGENTVSVEAFCCGRETQVSGKAIAKAMEDNYLNIETRPGYPYQGSKDTTGGYDGIFQPIGPDGADVLTAGTTITNQTFNDPSNDLQTEAFLHEGIHKLRGMWSRQEFHQLTFGKAVEEILRKY